MGNNISWIKHLKYRRCNIHPSSNAISITTNEESIYWICLEESRPAEIIIGKNARCCGIIRIRWDRDVLEICDLRIMGQHRGKGLGTKILLWIIAYAQQENIQQIWAIVSPENLCDFDRLMNWYLRYGFHRESPDGKFIIMDL
jgi:ribosomal protein S18 acetylase RimI-like enzyme